MSAWFKDASLSSTESATTTLSQMKFEKTPPALLRSSAGARRNSAGKNPQLGVILRLRSGADGNISRILIKDIWEMLKITIDIFEFSAYNTIERG